MKYIIWLKGKNHPDLPDGKWVEQGDGPLTKKTADRIAREIRDARITTRILPEGTQPISQ